MAEEARMSKATLARLPYYYRTITALADEGKGCVSSNELGEMMGIDPAQVRRDISSVGQFGRAGIGYNVDLLTAALEDVLGVRKPTEAVLIGVGRLGSALSMYPGFERYGLRIVALFDTDPEKAGSKLGDLLILPVSELKHVARRLGVTMAIITVPKDQAQAIADILVEAGITAIWNFAPVTLKVPEGVTVRDEDLAVGLAHLSRHLSARRNRRNTEGNVEKLESPRS